MFKEFLEKRKNQEKAHSENTKRSDSLFTKSLITVEINTTELCNRKCVFCPRVDPKIYPNRNLHIEISTINKIAKDLKKKIILKDGFPFQGLENLCFIKILN